ncbi:hypothetical protein CH278_19635 [Rhodococcus sp. 05-2254-5]|uniref:hypothetical protein n=1 Tax=unclassified Rhodococcus (in: high G+C Gram-positive bacteria) TaxID=192944 RepID=UPI000B9ACA59|nr:MULTISPECIES: hypothetical protein [unclassified Rhodococcus (in: high G+C Gram-positive bacteria)]OZE29080.1 hypothetical protein CH278_19635 [Rhodococcus sp. 05-2254-5]OZE53786.1 hypothetical protein CH269_21990 [Rhodococcus sp. 05-2254-1]
MTEDLTKGDNRETEPVNPYAVISLVAALLGLFPVAIVFGTWLSGDLPVVELPSRAWQSE